MEDSQQDICRVCRSEGAPDKPLYHPCVCTGSIKYIHQECLVQWLKYSKKEYCELCKHRFAFTPIYSPDMPKRLPIKDILSGLLRSVGRAVRYWFHYTLVAVAWLGVVPLTACRIYRCLFTGSVSSLLTLPLDMLSTENVLSDCFQGCFVVTCTLCAFISLVWLREQILHGGGPDWLEHDNPVPHARGNLNAPVGVGEAAPAPPPPDADGEEGEGVGEGPQAPHVEVDEEEEADNGGGGNGGNGAAQDDHWNPIEWDRAAEELTWERLLGLDGSLVFLEHVFWVVSLNTLFILVFAFCPYHIGHFTIVGLKSEDTASFTSNSTLNATSSNTTTPNISSVVENTTKVTNITTSVAPYTNLTVPADMLTATQFDGLLTTLLGYLLIAVSLVVLHFIATLARFRRSRRVVGLCYVVVKVSLLVVVEIGIFPLICGWWLDICSLSMFDATLKYRANSFKLAPGTSMFIHWLVGMVYVFYFASFILLLREVLRPGVLWFLRNLNDPDFNPIQEMIHLPVYRHVRRFLASMVIFGSTVLIMLWLPVRIIRYFLPNFLPYNVLLSSDAPVSELSLELLLLQVVLPALLEQGHTRQWLKNLVRGWCVATAWLLDLRSYLLGDVPLDDENKESEGEAEDVVSDDEVDAADEAEEEGEAEPLLQQLQADADVQEEEEGAAVEEDQEEGAEEAPPPQAAAPAPAAPAPAQGLGAAHQAMLQGGGPTGFQPFKKPTVFGGRIGALLTIMCFTLFLASLISFIVPVYIGRGLMALWMGDAKIHELYTAACGLYTCWVTLRAATVLYHWLPQGWRAILERITDWANLALKSLVVATVIIGLVPLLLGLLFELVIVAPLRVPLDQTPIFFPWQDWALGVLHAKIICAITMMGPQWWLKRVIEQVYNQGLRNMDLKFILRNLCAPVVGVLGMSLAVPYVVAKSLVPALGFDFEVQNLVLRRIYPFLLSVILLVSFCIFQAKQFRRLYEHIKNDKYLVGQRLVNYDKTNKHTQSTQTAEAAT